MLYSDIIAENERLPVSPVLQPQLRPSCGTSQSPPAEIYKYNCNVFLLFKKKKDILLFYRIMVQKLTLKN